MFGGVNGHFRRPVNIFDLRPKPQGVQTRPQHRRERLAGNKYIAKLIQRCRLADAPRVNHRFKHRGHKIDVGHAVGRNRFLYSSGVLLTSRTQNRQFAASPHPAEQLGN
ncbi:hypothetical protein D3C81_1819920 [compost metagenome]